MLRCNKRWDDMSLLGFEAVAVSCRVAPDWNLWRTFYRLSYSTAAWIPTCCSLASIRSTCWRCCRRLFFLRRQSSFFWRMPRKDLRADLSPNHWDLGPRAQLRPSSCGKYMHRLNQCRHLSCPNLSKLVDVKIPSITLVNALYDV